MRRAIPLVCLVLVLAAGTAAADLCQPGFYSPDGNAPCEPCLMGTFSSAEGSTECTFCPAGTFSSTEGSAECAPCAAGTFSNLDGSAACQVCPEGTIAPFLGSEQCEPCPPGYTSNESRTECVPVAVPTVPTTWGLLKALYR